MKLRWLLPLATALLGFSLGYVTDGRHSMTTRSSKERTGLAASEPGSATAGVDHDRGREVSIEERLRALCAHPSRAHRRWEFAKFFAGLPLDELQEAAREIAELPEFAREAAQEAMMTRLVELDPAVAVRYANGINKHFLLAWAWGERDLPAALEWTLEWPDGRGMKGQVLTSLFLKLAERDLDAAVQLFLREQDRCDDWTTQAVFRAWSKRDGAAATAQAAALENGTLRRAALEVAMNEWAQADPSAAAAWYREISDPILRAEAAGGLMPAIARTDPDAAVAIARELPDGRTQERAIAALAEFFRLNHRMEDGIALAGTIHFDPENKILMGYLGGLQFDSAAGPVEALLQRANAPDIDAQEVADISRYLAKDSPMRPDSAWMMEQLAAGTSPAASEIRHAVMPEVAARWSFSDAPAARSWMETLPPGETRELAVRGVTGGWAAANADDAARWIDDLPESSDRTAAIAGFAEAGLQRGDSDRVLALLRGIPDPGQRADALRKGWEAWMKADRGAAEQWRDRKLTAAERAWIQDPR